MRRTLVLVLLVPFAVLAAEIVRSFDAPDTAVSGLACTESQLWAVSATNSLYSLNPETGEILDSWFVSTTGGAPDGIGLAGSLLYITNGTSNVYKYTTTGTSQGVTSLWCSGWGGGTYYPVGGAGGSSTAVYFIGTSNQIYNASPLPLPAEIQPTQTGVLSGFGVYDIAIEGSGNSTGDIWVATDQATSPIRSYSSTGVLKNSINLVSSPRGLAYFSSGGVRYLWASTAAGTIYLIRIDNTGVGGSEGAPIGLALAASENPFDGMTTITGTGFSPGAVLEIFDLSGRKVVEAPFQDTFAWSGSSIPAGVYVARVTDPSGAEARLSLTRL